MAFEALLAEINLLINQMDQAPEDEHELYEAVFQKLSELKATGMPLPDDLVKLEEQLEARFAEDQD